MSPRLFQQGPGGGDADHCQPGVFKGKKKSEIRSFIPDYGRFATKARLYEQTIKDLQADKSRLEGEKEELQGDLKAANDKVKSRKLDEAQLKADLYNLQRQMEKIPPEIVAMYTGKRLNRERGD